MGKVHDAELVGKETNGSGGKALVRRSRGGGVLAKKAGAINFEKLLSTALESGATLDTMERVLAMRRELRAEAAEEQFTAALNRFQSLCPVLGKPKAVKNTKGANAGTVRYHYAPLDYIIRKVKPYMKKCGFSYKLTARIDEGGRLFIIVMELRHIAGHKELSEFPIPVNDSEFMTLLQNFGSSNSFAKRYAFCNALGIMTGDEDDDGRGSEDLPEEGDDRRRTPPRRPESRTSSGSKAPQGAKRSFANGPAEKIGESTIKVIRKKLEQGASDGGPTERDLLKRFNIMSISDIPANQMNLVMDWLKDPING